MKAKFISYKSTNAFSKLVVDYLAQEDVLKNFYDYTPDETGFEKALEERKKNNTDREVLVSVLEKQYATLDKSEKVKANIKALLDQNTFTICTAHQPNLLTGYLYFTYKILHAIKLADDMSLKYPHHKFVPVYYMGSEDNDLDELGVFYHEGRAYRWEGNGQTGAVGRMYAENVEQILNDFFQNWGPLTKDREELKKTLLQCYKTTHTIAEATTQFVNHLFGKFGLLVLNPDEAALKRQFKTVMAQDIFSGKSDELSKATSAALSEHYKAQAYSRPINLFYLKDQLRERIERNNDGFSVMNTTLFFTEKELSEEMDKHPENFSPNVILRGLYQETILPNVAFIGGGAEVAYWLQLKKIFEHYHVFYPQILLRQSVQLVDNSTSKLMHDLSLSETDIFQEKEKLQTLFLNRTENKTLNLTEEKLAFEKSISAARNRLKAIDPTLEKSAEAILKRVDSAMKRLEEKMMRSLKRKNHIQMQRFEKLHERVYPNRHLQERQLNICSFYPQYGTELLEHIRFNIRPLDVEFMILYLDQ